MKILIIVLLSFYILKSDPELLAMTTEIIKSIMAQIINMINQPGA